MATVITAGNATNGLSFTSDNTGSLDIKTGTGAGTTAISISSSQIATFAGAASVPGNLSFNSGYGSAAVAYGCRAWVNFNGVTTATIRASGNVSSVTRNGTGNYTINFTIAMPDANYNVSGAVNFSATANNAAIALMPLVYSVGSIQVNTCTNGGQLDSLFVNVSIFR